MRALALVVLVGCGVIQPHTAPTASADRDATAERAMPNVVGKTLAEATQILRAAGFTEPPREEGAICADEAAVAPETISCQDRAPGTSVRTFHELGVHVAHAQRRGTGIFESDLMKLVGMPVADAKAALVDLGYVGTIEVQETSDFTAGCKIGTVCNFTPRTTFAHSDGRVMKLYINRASVDFAKPSP